MTTNQNARYKLWTLQNMLDIDGAGDDDYYLVDRWELDALPGHEELERASEEEAREVLEQFVYEERESMQFRAFYQSWKAPCQPLSNFDDQTLMREVLDEFDDDFGCLAMVKVSNQLPLSAHKLDWEALARSNESKDIVELAPVSTNKSWVAVECVDDSDERKPVRGVRFEVITAGGDLLRASSNENGVALVDRIAPGRTTIRVLDTDGNFWKPLEGEASQPANSNEGTRWHVVAQGETLGDIASQYGVKSWKTIWDDPKNEPLRKKRGVHNLVRRGDNVAVPGAGVYEFVRATENTHRIQIAKRPDFSLRWST